MDQGQAMVAKIQGFTAAQISQQCSDFGGLLAEQTAALATTPRAAMVPQVAGFAASTGMNADQLAGTAKICLSVGYRTDDMGVAVASALVLAGLGQDAYGELLGHHLVSGIGTAERADLAMDWYEGALTATPVFAPGQPERSGLIRKATMMMNGQTVAPMPKPEPVAAQGGLSLKGFASKAAGLLDGSSAASQ